MEVTLDSPLILDANSGTSESLLVVDMDLCKPPPLPVRSHDRPLDMGELMTSGTLLLDLTGVGVVIAGYSTAGGGLITGGLPRASLLAPTGEGGVPAVGE